MLFFYSTGHDRLLNVDEMLALEMVMLDISDAYFL